MTRPEFKRAIKTESLKSLILGVQTIEQNLKEIPEPKEDYELMYIRLQETLIDLNNEIFSRAFNC